MKPESVWCVNEDVFCHFCVCCEFPERAKKQLTCCESVSWATRVHTQKHPQTSSELARRIHMAQATSSQPLAKATPASS